MKKYLLYLLIVPLVVFSGCGEDDEPEPTHEIGTWELQGFIMTDFPDAYSIWDGGQYAVSALGWDSFTMELNIDGTYELDVEAGLSDLNDSGTWTLSGDELTFDSNVDDDNDIEWEVVDNANDDLDLKLPFQSLWPTTADVDSLLATDEYQNATDTEKNDLLNSLDNDVVSHSIIYVLEREQ